MKYFLFNLVGICSALTFVMLGVLIIPGALQGDFAIIHKMWTAYPGSQPFVIVMMPVMFITGIAWIWKLISNVRAGSHARPDTQTGPAEGSAPTDKPSKI